MKTKVVLGLVLLLVVLVASFNLFYVSPGSGNVTSTGAPILVVVAKQDYFYARVELTIHPYLIGNQQLTLRFPNGTVQSLTTVTTVDIVLPNSIYYRFGEVSSGAPACTAIGRAEPNCVTLAAPGTVEGCGTSSSEPIGFCVLSVANATASYATEYAPTDGIHAYQYLINGTGSADVEITASGVSL
jgi:hypothetical protein